MCCPKWQMSGTTMSVEHNTTIRMPSDTDRTVNSGTAAPAGTQGSQVPTGFSSRYAAGWALPFPWPRPACCPSPMRGPLEG